MAVTYTNADKPADRGFIVSSNEATVSLSATTWSSAIELSANSVNARSRTPSSSSIWEDLVFDFTVATDGGTVRVEAWWDAACTKVAMGPSAANEVQNLGASCSIGGKRLTYPTDPEAVTGLAVGVRRLYVKLYPSAAMTLAIGGIRANWDSSRSR